MRKLIAFNSVSVDGYFTDAGDMTWAHKGSDDPEYSAFMGGNASGGGQLVFGRITYDMMAAYWPTPLARQNNPVVAEGMNRMPKVVFSRTMDRSAWSNTTVVKGGDIAKAIADMKNTPGDDMAILGSGSIVAQLTSAGLIDEYQIVVCPIILGKGRTLFERVQKRIDLKLTKSRTFRNGKVFLCYERGA